MSSPLVSVAIPSFNHAQFVADAIASVLGQTVADVELLVIDDGSADGSPDLIRRYLSHVETDKVVRTIFRENRGLPATLNEALLLSRGTYFSYLGSDDLLEPRKLERQLVAIAASSPPVAAAFSTCHVIDAAGRRTGRIAGEGHFHGGDIYDSLLRMRFHPPSPTNLFLRERLLELGGFDTAMAVEDRDLWLRLACIHRVAYVHEPLASFRIHSRNTSTNRLDLMSETNRMSFDKAFAVDPLLRAYRYRVDAALDAGLAAVHYNNLELRTARSLAIAALRRDPTNRLGWSIVGRSLLPTGLVEWARHTRARRRANRIDKDRR